MACHEQSEVLDQDLGYGNWLAFRSDVLSKSLPLLSVDFHVADEQLACYCR